MVQFGEVKSATTRVAYKKDDIAGYLVEGEVTYDLLKNVVTDARGDIRSIQEVEPVIKKNIGSFDTHGVGDDMRITLNCPAKQTDVVNDLAKATLADLANGYKE